MDAFVVYEAVGTFPFDQANPHAWISILVFALTIIFVILAPEIPIPIPTKKFIYKILKLHKPIEEKEAKLDVVHEKGHEEIHVEHENEKHIAEHIEMDSTEFPVMPHEDIVDIHHEQPILPANVELTVEIPVKSYWIYKFPIDLGSAPVIALIFMFCTTTLSWKSFVNGIIGDDFIQPYSIIILFMALAYVCISLDMTGIFKYLAFLIIQKSNGKGHRMWFGLCAFASVLTIFTSNDVVILTLTPICCYMASQSDLDPMPFMFSQFFLANIWSISLMIGNPTNIIVAEAYKLGFLTYMSWMVIPAVVAGVSCWIILYIVFYRKIPNHVTLKGDLKDPREYIQSRVGAIVKSVGMLSCLLFLAVSSALTFDWWPVKLWMICAGYGLAYFVFDIVFDIYHLIRDESNHNMTFEALWRLPWKIIPFVVGMFVSVELLKIYGWISLFANWIAVILMGIAPTALDGGAGTAWSIFSSSILMAFVSSGFCNILNNQPMTILFTNLLNDTAFAVTPIMKLGSTLALIIGSNLGANITLIGALAGIMWNSILAQNNMKVGYFKFLMYGLIVTPLVILFSSFALSIELVVYHFGINGGIMSNSTSFNTTL